MRIEENDPNDAHKNLRRYVGSKGVADLTEEEKEKLRKLAEED